MVISAKLDKGRPLRVTTQAVIADEQNYILDLDLGEIHDAPALARALNAIAGVVEHGLFLNICQLAIIGRPDGSVVELQREEMQ